MKVLCYISGYDGCGYYRIQSPAKYLNKYSDVMCKISTQYSKEDISWADIVILQKQVNQRALDFVEFAKKEGKKIITEVDDDYFHIPTWNPAYKYYHNKPQELINFYKMSDAIVVTTPHLARQLSVYNPNTFVLPNSIDLKEVAKIEKLPKEDLYKFTRYLTSAQEDISLEKIEEISKDKIVIGWGGSPTHLRDLDQATPALLKICRENKNVHLHLIACGTEALLKGMPPDQLFLIRPVPIFQYPRLLASLKWDIGICPIEDNLFNRSKSNLKFLEFSINSIPCVCSNVENYAKTVREGVTGLLADNTAASWYDKLTQLINSKEMRESISQEAKKQVMSDFSMEKNALLWYDCYQNILGS